MNFQSIHSNPGLLLILAAISGIFTRPSSILQVNSPANFTQYAVKIIARSDCTITQGSGVLVGTDGQILTNWHNVSDASQINIELSDGRRSTASLLAFDPVTDLCLLQSNVPGQYACIQLADTVSVPVGSMVYAIGNPGPLDFSITTGMVGGLDRQIGAIPAPKAVEAFIQTSVPLNPGCSGGPLLNETGQLVGINTAIWSVSGRFEGYSFAIPVKIIQPFLDRYFFKKNNPAPVTTP